MDLSHYNLQLTSVNTGEQIKGEIMSLGPWEIVIIMLVIILIFGGKKIPELARGLGKGLKEFQKTTNEIKDEVNAATEDVKSSIDDTEE